MTSLPRSRKKVKLSALLHHLGELAAIRIAQHDAVRPGARRHAQCREGVLLVQAAAVEEMLGIVNDLFAPFPEKGHALRDHAQILVPAHLEHPFTCSVELFPTIVTT